MCGAVDMSVPYEASVPRQNTDFADIRDSFYILTNMNQYSMGHMAAVKKESEGLLRIALFSKDLRLYGTDKQLKDVRRDLAERLRNARKKGVVPVFISTLWFLFSLAISIQDCAYRHHCLHVLRSTNICIQLLARLATTPQHTTLPLAYYSDGCLC